jgi:hypothetical protein
MKMRSGDKQVVFQHDALLQRSVGYRSGQKLGSFGRLAGQAGQVRLGRTDSVGRIRLSRLGGRALSDRFG